VGEERGLAHGRGPGLKMGVEVAIIKSQPRKVRCSSPPHGRPIDPVPLCEVVDA